MHNKNTEDTNNCSMPSYDHRQRPRETGDIHTNYRATDVLLTDNFMVESDCDIPSPTTTPVSSAPSRLRDGSETYDDDEDSQATRPHTPSSAKQESHTRNKGVCTISHKEAVIIFLAGSRLGSYGSRGKLSDRLSKEFGITSKAVRDIWNLRTWARATRPHWTPSDEEAFTKKKSGAACCNFKRKPTPQTYHNIHRFDGEWMIDPSFIAEDFDAVLMELHDIVRQASPLQPVSR
jgi:hypothetical protein